MLQPKKRNKQTWKEDKEFLQNWYKNRVLPNENLNNIFQLEKNKYVKSASKLPDPTFVESIDKDNTQGAYNRKTKEIQILDSADPFVYTHEGSHAITAPLDKTKSSTQAFTSVRDNIKNKENVNDDWVKDNYEYLNYYEEVIGRINSYRQLHQLKPDQEITPDLIKSNRESYNKGDIPFEDNTDQLYKLFEDEGLSNILNTIVSNTNNQKTETQYAELGGIMTDDMKGPIKPKKTLEELLNELGKPKVNKAKGNTQKQSKYTKLDKAREILTHPLTAFGYSARNEDLPNNFTKGETNALDNVLSLINPASRVESGLRAMESLLFEGDVAGTLANAVGIFNPLRTTALTSSGMGRLARNKKIAQFSGNIIKSAPTADGMLEALTGTDFGEMYKENKNMKNKTNKKPKYDMGSYVQNPSVDLTENQIAMAAAQNKGANNPWTQGLDIFGSLATQLGTSMMNSPNAGKTLSGGEASTKGMTGFLNKNSKGTQNSASILSGLSNVFALGGIADDVDIEAEGGEVVETPNGEPVELKGPSHAQGGIDLEVPEGTEIYSKKLKGPDGKSMADRKKRREKSISNIEKLLSESPTDKTLQKTLSKIKSNTEREEQSDMSTMQMARFIQQSKEQFALGGPVLPRPTINTEPDFEPFSLEMLNPTSNLTLADLEARNPTPVKPSLWGGLKDKINNLNINLPTAGDAMGFAGLYKAGNDPMKNTLANRASDTPNINPYENFGKDALNKTAESKSFASQIREQQLKALAMAKSSATTQNRNGARGINTLRALDLATQMGGNKQESEIYNQFAQSMQAILGQEAGLENQQDQMVMQGEGNRDMNDRRDKDSFFSQMAQDINSKNTSTQLIGKEINNIKERNVKGKLMNTMFDNFKGDINNGNISKIMSDWTSPGAQFIMNLPEDIRAKVLSKEYEKKGDKIIDKATGKEVKIK